MIQGVQELIRPFDEAMHRDGCYFLALLQWGLYAAGRPDLDGVNVRELLAWRDRVLKEGWVTADYTVKNPAPICNLAAGRSLYRDARHAAAPEGSRYIVYWKKPQYEHFSLVYDGAKWDPLMPDRPAMKSYTAAGYRLLV